LEYFRITKTKKIFRIRITGGGKNLQTQAKWYPHSLRTLLFLYFQDLKDYSTGIPAAHGPYFDNTMESWHQNMNFPAHTNGG
jgi:hypothetical protein